MCVCVCVYGYEATTRKPELLKAVCVDIQTREKKKKALRASYSRSAVSTRRVRVSFRAATRGRRARALRENSCPPPSPPDVGFAADASILLGGGLHFDSFRPFVGGASRVQDRLPHMTRVFVPVISASISVNQCR